MCRPLKKCAQKFIKSLIRLFLCIFCCRCKRRPQKADDQNKKDDDNLTSIKVDENLMKKLFNNDTFSANPTSANSLSNNYSHNKGGSSMWKFPDSDNQSIATTNTENFEMMETFSKDVNVQNRATLMQHKNMPGNQVHNEDPLAAQVIYNSRRAMIGRKETQIKKSSNINDNPDHPINLGYEATLSMLHMSKDIKKKKADKQS